MLSVAYWAI